MDEVAMFSASLSAEDIAEVYNGGSGANLMDGRLEVAEPAVSARFEVENAPEIVGWANRHTTSDYVWLGGTDCELGASAQGKTTAVRADDTPEAVALAAALAPSLLAYWRMEGADVSTTIRDESQTQPTNSTAEELALVERLRESLLGYWNFEDGPGSATASDTSGNGHVGRIRGDRHDATKWPLGYLAGGSYAQDFRGTLEDSIIVDEKAGMPTGNEPRTTMLWMRGCSGDGSHGLFVLGCPTTGQIWNWRIGAGCTRLHMDFNSADCEWGSDVGDCNDYSDISGGGPQWQHLAITYDGSTLVGYRNGVEIARQDPTTAPDTCAVDSTTAGGYNFNIGAAYSGDVNSGGSDPFYGQMDEVAVFGAPLSGDDVAAVYNNGRGLSLATVQGQQNRRARFVGPTVTWVQSDVAAGARGLHFHGDGSFVQGSALGFPEHDEARSMMAWVKFGSQQVDEHAEVDWESLFGYGNGDVNWELLVNRQHDTMSMGRACLQGVLDFNFSAFENDDTWHQIVIVYSPEATVDITALPLTSDQQAVVTRLQQSLIGYWNFEDGPGSATASDASGNGHVGRIKGSRHDAGKWPVSCLAGGSYAQDFRGTIEDTIIVDEKAGMPTGNEPRTTMFWCDPSTLSPVSL